VDGQNRKKEAGWHAIKNPAAAGCLDYLIWDKDRV
jgi:hypothetical protein